MTQAERWESFYAQRLDNPVYPKEWVVRVFAGGVYPRLRMDKRGYEGARILDLGCGDGRHVAFLEALGFRVSATEISDEIVRGLQRNAARRGWRAEFVRGTAGAIPFGDVAFDAVLASASCHYLEGRASFDDNLREIARVIAPGGTFVASVPLLSSEIVRDTPRGEDGSVLIQHDPQALRDGSRLFAVQSAEELESVLSPHFTDITTGSSRNDYFGHVLDFVFCVCRKPVAR
jgi:SAM-dependent methyltransferase